MDSVGHRPRALARLFGVAEELVGTGGGSVHFRCLHHEDDSLDMVEEVEERNRDKCDELGGCHRFCLGSGVFRELVFLPELCHPFFLVGEIVAGG